MKLLPGSGRHRLVTTVSSRARPEEEEKFLEKRLRLDLPKDMSAAQFQHDIRGLVAHLPAKLTVEAPRQSANAERLGQIDGTVVEIIIRILDTEAAEEVVSASIAAISGYILGKTGKKTKIDLGDDEKP